MLVQNDKLNVSVIIHTLNEEKNLPYALKSVINKFNEIFIVDSGSIDNTRQIANEFGVNFIERKSDRTKLVEQRNWALDTLPFRNEWVFVLDADEQVPEDLYEEIKLLMSQKQSNIFGYWICYKNIVLGKWLKHSSIYPNWNMRLFMHNKLRYEDRSVNAHINIDNKNAGWLQSHFIHDDKRGFKAYIQRLANITVIESETVDEIHTSTKNMLNASLFSSSPVERRRAFKKFYYKMPFRPIIVFIYLYFFKLGFLDGKAGLYYVLYRSFQDLLINILKYEREITREK